MSIFEAGQNQHYKTSEDVYCVQWQKMKLPKVSTEDKMYPANQLTSGTTMTCRRHGCGLVGIFASNQEQQNEGSADLHGKR